MTSILITGGAGFIGSHICIELLRSGHNLYVVDSLVNSSINSIRKIEELNKKFKSNNSSLVFKQLDIRDPIKLKEVFNLAIKQNNEIRSVIHLAGLKSVASSYIDKDEYFDVNVNGSKNLLKIMEYFGCLEFVFSSSATVYDPFSLSPISETAEINPINPYGKTKFEVEKILLNKYEKCNKWKIICLRYFNPIGSHPSGEIGELPLKNPDNLFPYLCQVALGKKKFLSIYGKDWPTKDGTGIRDYIHIMDLVEGHIAALNFLREKNETFKIVNLGTGKGTTVLELVKTFEKVNNLLINYKFVERRKGDLGVVYADVNYSKKLLNWSAKYDISDMCKDGWLFNKKFPNGLQSCY